MDEVEIEVVKCHRERADGGRVNADGVQALQVEPHYTTQL